MKIIFFAVLCGSGLAWASPEDVKFVGDLCASLGLSSEKLAQCREMGFKEPNSYAAALYICSIDEKKEPACLTRAVTALAQENPTLRDSSNPCRKKYAAQPDLLSQCFKNALLGGDVKTRTNQGLAPKEITITYPKGYVPPPPPQYPTR